ncbi:RNA polymerase I enhancer binding protein [Sporothrix epigloea]|uniref:RNA polymerase I enhancer binding protein n=1 Tax=Sporothrix epigloea TaxID=1892477 RepID=A0ABP0DCT2_9PEZI
MTPSMAKRSRFKALPPPKSKSNSRSGSASNTRTKQGEKLQSLAKISRQLGRDAVGEGDSNDDDDDDDDGYRPPQRPIFLSSVVNPSSQPAAIVATEHPSSSRSGSFSQPGNDTTSDEDEDESNGSSSGSSNDDSSSSSGSESEDGEDDRSVLNQDSSATTIKANTKTKKMAATPVEKVSAPDSSSGDDSGDSSDSSSSNSSSSSDSDSSEDDNEAKVARRELLLASTAPTPATKGNEGEVESSDDDMEDIPYILPPGTSADIVTKNANKEAEATDASERENTPVKESEAPQLGATTGPQLEALPTSSVQSFEPELEPVTAQSTPPVTRQRPKKQVAKRSLVSGQVKASEHTTNSFESSDTEPATNGAPQPDPVPDVPSSANSPRKRKRATNGVTKQDRDESAPASGPLSAGDHTAAQSPEPRSSMATAASGGGLTKKGPQGNFTSQEVERLVAAAAKYMKENHVLQSEFNALVHDNAQKHTAMWDQIIADFPDKKRLQVILRCRRIFHNFKQLYHWSDEQDAELAELVIKHGNKWQEIASAMGRSSEDVRKRWNERVMCGENVLLSYWRFDEEKRLGQVVGQLLREIQTTRKQDTATVHHDAVRDMPWHTVSERMDHTRTARQCRIKWRAIQDAYQFNADGEFVGPPPPTELSNSQIKAEKMHQRLLKVAGSTPAKKRSPKTPGEAIETPTKTPKGPADRSPAKSRLPLLGITPEEDGLTVPETARPINDLTRKQVRSMTTEDKYRLVKSIRDSNVGREDRIPWTRLVDVSYRRRYERAARELVWSRLKRAVPNYHRKSVRQICEYLIKEYDANAKLGHGWDVDFDTEPQGEEAALDGDDDATALPSTSAIVQAIAAAKGKSPGKASESNNLVAKFDNDDNKKKARDDAEEGAIESLSMEEAAEALSQPRARRGFARAARANGEMDDDAENHVSESENEVTVNARPTRRAGTKARGQSVKGAREQALVAPFLDVEEAASSSDSQEEAAQVDEIEDVDDDDDDRSGRGSREASVDLSMGGKLSSVAGGGGDEDGTEPAAQDELPSTLSLSPRLAHSQPTVRSRPLALAKKRSGSNDLETSSSATAHRPARAGRFQQSKPTSLTPLRPNDVHRTMKRSLSTPGLESALDDMEDPGEIDKGAFHLSAISGLVKSAFTPRKRPRRDGGQ